MTALNITDLDRAPCGYLVFNDDGEILRVNQTLVTLLGFVDKTTANGRSLESILTISGKLFYQTHFFPLIKLHGKAEEIFFWLVGTTGERVPVICNAHRTQEAGQWVNQCIFFPVRQRSLYEQELLRAKKEAENEANRTEALEQARRTLEDHALALDRRLARQRQINENLIQFGKIVSHDLQEPIRKTTLFAAKVIEQNIAVLKPQSRVELEKIEVLSKQIRQLAMSLEHFVSLGVLPDTPTPVDLPELIRKAIRQIDDDGRLDAIFNFGFLPVIEGYPVQLQELFFQLLHNAVSYRDVSRTLTIGIGATIVQQNIYQEFKAKHRYESFARIVLTDDGPGFDASGDIFRILRHPDNRIRKLSFGLAFCKQITDNHFGSIDVLSEPGKGTTVTILLPLVQETEKINEHYLE